MSLNLSTPTEFAVIVNTYSNYRGRGSQNFFRLKFVRINEILEIHPDETLRASLSPDEMKELIYRKCEPEDEDELE